MYLQSSLLTGMILWIVFVEPPKIVSMILSVFISIRLMPLLVPTHTWERFGPTLGVMQPITSGSAFCEGSFSASVSTASRRKKRIFEPYLYEGRVVNKAKLTSRSGREGQLSLFINNNGLRLQADLLFFLVGVDVEDDDMHIGCSCPHPVVVDSR